MSKINTIIEAWKNVIWKNQKIEEEAKRRAEICNDCENNIFNVCKLCGCPLISKCRSEDKCPINKW